MSYADFKKSVKRDVNMLGDTWAEIQANPASLEANLAKLQRMSERGYDLEGKIEQTTTDIASRDIGKRKLRSRQMARMASMVGSVQPRTQAQTASLLSGGQSSSTLLG